VRAKASRSGFRSLNCWRPSSPISAIVSCAASVGMISCKHAGACQSVRLHRCKTRQTFSQGAPGSAASPRSATSHPFRCSWAENNCCCRLENNVNKPRTGTKGVVDRLGSVQSQIPTARHGKQLLLDCVLSRSVLRGNVYPSFPGHRVLCLHRIVELLHEHCPRETDSSSRRSTCSEQRRREESET
jgi:hypothetical protein